MSIAQNDGGNVKDLDAAEEAEEKAEKAVAATAEEELLRTTASNTIVEQTTIEAAAVDKAKKSADKASAEFEGIHIPDDLKTTVKLLVMAEQTDTLTAVLSRLNGDQETWQRAQKEPVTLLTLIIHEQQKRMDGLQRKIGAEMQRVRENKKEDRRNRITGPKVEEEEDEEELADEEV